jgi:serine/threonine-protein kinase
MEFVQGESLSHLIRGASARGERIPQDIVVGIMVGALQGLHAAHEAKSEQGEPLNIVHRDVSPQNVLVGIDGVARILDFGVAKAVGNTHQTTQEGQLKGKLSYMSPEQINGTVSRATDVYAASVVLWEALSGKPLFKAENGGQTLGLVLKGCDVPPSAHVPSIPAAVDAVVMRGLRLDPTQRFATAREMARALEGAMAPATPSRIGDWVEAAAKESIDQRSATIATIESDSSLQMIPRTPSIGALQLVRPPASSSPSLVSGPTPATVAESHAALTDHTASTAALRLSLSARPKRSNAWLAVAGGVLALLAVVVLASRGGSKPAAQPDGVTTGSGGTASAAPKPVMSQDPPTASGEPVPSASPDLGVATGAASAAPSSSPTKAPATPRTAPAHGSHAAATPAHASTPTCSVVTTYGADGEPHFQKVCK